MDAVFAEDELACCDRLAHGCFAVGFADRNKMNGGMGARRGGCGFADALAYCVEVC